jgi:leucyl aminopeptidase (aminopeptidase T)
MLYGRGAGALPTASAVVSDVIYAATHTDVKYSTFKNTATAENNVKFVSDFSSAYYIRLSVEDKAGVLAKISGIFAKYGISIVEVAQRGQKADENSCIPVIVITHQTTENRVKKAVEKMWQVILQTSRADGKNPVKAWKEHNADLQSRCDYLNALGLVSLQYTSANGTNLTVGLNDDGVFCGGQEKTLKGRAFNPNIPTEEVFTSPKAGSADGVVYSTKPHSYMSELIDNFSLRFEKGKVVEVHAEQGEDLLKEMVSMDDGAGKLGECALIPYASPISQSGVLFYNTLFDENASCHLALGHGFNECLKNYQNYTDEQCKSRGINDSMIHVDFMIGAKDTAVVGITKDGKQVQIFKDGNWAF